MEWKFCRPSKSANKASKLNTSQEHPAPTKPTKQQPKQKQQHMKKIFFAAAILAATIQSTTAQTFCHGTTKTGNPCSRKAGINGYCYQHNPTANHCKGTTKAGQPCKAIVKEGTQFCHLHNTQK